MKRLFKTSAFLFVAVASLIFIPRTMASADPTKVLVIVKADGSLPDLALKDIKAIYLGDKLYVGSSKIEPLVNGDEALAGVFFKKVLDKTKAQFKKIWSTKGFVDGLAAPATLPTGEDILRDVLKSDTAIGFIAEKDLSASAKKSVRVLYTAVSGDK
jgi:hypothetical protein